jgi:hypothetical protein
MASRTSTSWRRAYLRLTLVHTPTLLPVRTPTMGNGKPNRKTATTAMPRKRAGRSPVVLIRQWRNPTTTRSFLMGLTRSSRSQQTLGQPRTGLLPAHHHIHPARMSASYIM